MALERWNIDTTHSGVHFTVRHMVISKVHGRFAKFAGTIDFDAENPAASRVEVKIDAASIDTAEAQRDGHLRSPDFLGVEQFPEITFRSTAVAAKGDGYQVTGDLTIHGVTRPVVLEAEFLGRAGKDPWGNERAGFTARTSVDRKAYGLLWNQILEAGGLLVGEKIEITLEVEAVRAQAAVAA